MTLLQMTYIMEIYRLSSMNKAANSLYISQSTISNAVKEVEEELGIYIFNRNNKGVSLTDDGKELISQIEPIVNQSKRLRKYYKERKLVNKRKFSVASQRYQFCAKAFVEFIKEDESGLYNYRFSEGDTKDIIEEVASRSSEIGVLFITDETKKFLTKLFDNRDLEFKELRWIRPRIFLAKNHPLAKQLQVDISGILEYPQIIFDKRGENNYNFAEEPLEFKEFQQFKKMISVRDRASAYNIIANSDAVSLSGGILLEGYCDPHITSVELAGTVELMCIGYIKTKDMHLSDEAKKYLSKLEEVLATFVG